MGVCENGLCLVLGIAAKLLSKFEIASDVERETNTSKSTVSCAAMFPSAATMCFHLVSSVCVLIPPCIPHIPPHFCCRPRRPGSVCACPCYNRCIANVGANFRPLAPSMMARSANHAGQRSRWRSCFDSLDTLHGPPPNKVSRQN